MSRADVAGRSCGTFAAVVLPLVLACSLDRGGHADFAAGDGGRGGLDASRDARPAIDAERPRPDDATPRADAIGPLRDARPIEPDVGPITPGDAGPCIGRCAPGWCGDDGCGHTCACEPEQCCEPTTTLCFAVLPPIPNTCSRDLCGTLHDACAPGLHCVEVGPVATCEPDGCGPTSCAMTPCGPSPCGFDCGPCMPDCGGIGRTCCEMGVCGEALRCESLSNTCQPCGMLGQPCCAGNACIPPAGCSPFTRTCGTDS